MHLSQTAPGPRPGPIVSARALAPDLPEPVRQALLAREAAVAEPFIGITADGRLHPGLFAVQPTGVPTAPIAAAAQAFYAALAPERQALARFTVESDAWRRWSNVHRFFMRHGVCLDDVEDAQRERALDLLRASLSQRGFETARNIMHLGHTVGELTGRLGEEYGEWLYWVSLLGLPSTDAPWGWQFDGHHLNLNCFVLGDQLVFTPMFMGAEPVVAENGRYAGTRVFDAEQQAGLALVRSLNPAQLGRALLGQTIPADVFATSFRDNLQLAYAGIRYGDLSAAQHDQLVNLIEVYVGRMRPEHAAIRMAEIERHLPETYFAWMGDFDEQSVFYYRVHSPVVLIEFDHQSGVAFDNDAPGRNHIHTVMRTPNGNDYGKDLLRQHYARFDHRHPGHL
jgi:hypothetical protein